MKIWLQRGQLCRPVVDVKPERELVENPGDHCGDSVRRTLVHGASKSRRNAVQVKGRFMHAKGRCQDFVYFIILWNNYYYYYYQSMVVDVI